MLELQNIDSSAMVASGGIIQPQMWKERQFLKVEKLDNQRSRIVITMHLL